VERRESWLHSRPSTWGECLASKDASDDREQRFFWRVAEEGRAKVQRLPRLTIAALDFESDAAYRATLRAAGVTPVRLGAGFERFLEERKKVDGGEEIPEV
jgi:hypothetical protein